MYDYHWTERRLSNGLRLLYLPIPTVPYVFVSLMSKVGRRSELDHEVGAAHFLEHLYFDGTTRYPTAHELSTYIDSYGGLRNGVTDAETVDYWVKVMSEHAEVAFDYLADITLHSKLEEIEKERKVIKQEALMNRDKIDRAILRYHKHNLFPNQPIGRTIFDEAENLPAMTRDLLISYRDRTYGVSNFLLTVVGNISEKQATAIGESYFAQFPSAPEVSFAPAHIQEKKTIRFHHQDLSQSHFIISYDGFAQAREETYAAQLLAIILGGSTSSRLDKRIRQELHLVYHVACRHHEYSDCGHLAIQSSLEEANLQQALDAIKDEIANLLKNGIPPDELTKAKNVLLARTMFSLEGARAYSWYHGIQALFQSTIIGVTDFATRIKSLSADEVLSTAQTIFSHEPKITIATKDTTHIDY